jgi:single-strand DNA-binding protein
MASLNKVFLIGNLTRDPELRYTPGGAAVANFTVAVNRAYKLPSGEKREETSFIRVVSWGRQAETCGEYLQKGSPVFVEGRLQSRSWDTPEGQKRSTIEVNAMNIQFLSRGGAGGRGPAAAQPPAEEAAPAREPLEEISLDLPPEEAPSESGREAGQDVPF